MVVYVEIVIINNFFIDLLLIVSTLAIRRSKVSKIRILTVSFFGASVAVIYAVLPDYAKILVRILLSPLMTLPLVKKKKDYLPTLVVFVCLTYLLGGIIEGIKNLIGIDINGYPLLGLVCFGAVLLEILVVTFVTVLPKYKRKICTVDIVVCGVKTHARALCDSGNSLVDEFSGKPVIILSKAFDEKLTALDDGKRNIEGFISVKTVNNESSLPLVKLDEVVVDGKRYDAYGAISSSDFDDCDLILQNTMF